MDMTNFEKPYQNLSKMPVYSDVACQHQSHCFGVISTRLTLPQDRQFVLSSITRVPNVIGTQKKN